MESENGRSCDGRQGSELRGKEDDEYNDKQSMDDFGLLKFRV